MQSDIIRRTVCALLLAAVCAPGVAGAQYTTARSRTFHKQLEALNQHLIIVSSMTMYLSSRGLAQKKLSAKDRKYLAKYLKTSSMATTELRNNLLSIRHAFREASSRKVKARLFKGRRASFKDVKQMVHKFVAGIDNFYALSGSLVQRYVTGKEQAALDKLIAYYRNQVRGIANEM